MRWPSRARVSRFVSRVVNSLVGRKLSTRKGGHENCGVEDALRHACHRLSDARILLASQLLSAMP